MSPLLLIAIGAGLLAGARALRGSDSINRHTYSRRYSDAPGADYENKPELQ